VSWSVLRGPRETARARGHFAGVLVVASTTAAAAAAGLSPANTAVVFLLGVLATASRFGLGPSITVSLAGAASLNYFFTEPRFSLVIAERESLWTVVLFVAAAGVTSKLAAKLRSEAVASRLNARRTATLYDFNRRVSAAIGQDDVLWAVVHHVASAVSGHSLVLMSGEGGLRIMAGYPPEDRLDEASARAARWAWEHQAPAGRDLEAEPDSRWLFVPMRTGRGLVGVLGVALSDDDRGPSPETRRLIGTLADQAAIALERTALVADIERARVATETERLRSALLSSLSHDLRTPLASILGAATSLNNYDATLRRPERLELIQTIQEEAERLNRFVQNLLDMTRIGAGALRPRTDWTDLSDVIGAAVQRARPTLGRRRVRVDLEPGLPLLKLDAVLMEQVFFNLVDNARKYAPDGTDIAIGAERSGDMVSVRVVDRGSGIPPTDRERVFDMFYRVEAGDSQPAGTGLGLAICRGIVEAHGGEIAADTGPDGRGTTIRVALPVQDPPEIPEQAIARDGASERS